MTRTWDEHHYGFALNARQKSKDSTQVGAVLVSPEGADLLTAFNGPPRGVNDAIPARWERPTKYLFVSHAEENLISFAARMGIRTHECTVYVTHMPCARCARAMIQAGIVEVKHGSGVTSMPAEEFSAALEMLAEAGVKVTAL